MLEDYILTDLTNKLAADYASIGRRTVTLVEMTPQEAAQIVAIACYETLYEIIASATEDGKDEVVDILCVGLRDYLAKRRARDEETKKAQA